MPEMIEACIQGDLGRVQWCLERGDDARWRDACGRTLLLYACSAGHLGVMQLLRRFGACVRTPDDNGRTPMSWAIYTGRLDIAQWLYSAGAAEDVRTPTRTECAPLFESCIRGVPLEILQWLYDSGAAGDICKKNQAGCGPLHLACSMGHVRHVKWLLDHGARPDLYAKNVFGHTPLESATRICNYWRVDVVMYLIVEEGVLNAPSGQLCPKTLNQMVPSESARTEVLRRCREITQTHATFRTILRAVNRSNLSALAGFEESVMVLIADFLEVFRGKKLRVVRDAARVLTDELGA